jgi:hypothetical protein
MQEYLICGDFTGSMKCKYQNSDECTENYVPLLHGNTLMTLVQKQFPRSFKKNRRSLH